MVTGASRGIGRACAQALSAAGARVALLARSPAPLEALAATLEDAVAIPCDVTDAAALQGASALVLKTFGTAPDVLVNNAGLFEIGAAHETDPARFEAMLATNLAAPFRLLQAFLAPMRLRGSGHVVTIGSIADRAVFPGNAAYAASKHGLRALHEVLRAETRGTGVRATLVSPGPVDTPLWDPLDPDHREGFTPRAQMLRPDAVADAVLWVITRPPETTIEELRLGRS